MKPKLFKKRNPIIYSAFNSEVDLKTRLHADKKKFIRKPKYKEKYEEPV